LSGILIAHEVKAIRIGIENTSSLSTEEEERRGNREGGGRSILKEYRLGT